MDFHTLPNLEYATDLTGAVLVAKGQSSDGETVVVSEMWFDLDQESGAYERAFVGLVAEVTRVLGPPDQQGLGFDENTLEPIPALEAHDIFADQFALWSAAKLIACTAQEDKELPIEIWLAPFPPHP